MLVKKLEAKMTYGEVLEYLEKHPRYRFMTKEECREHGILLTWIKGESNDDTCRLASTNEGVCNHLLKLSVYLLPTLTKVQTGVVFYIEDELLVELVGENIRLTREEMVHLNGSDLFNTEVNLDYIIEAMTERDIVVFRVKL